MLSGSCLCGGVRFEVDGKLGPVIQCHCTMCRKFSGTAFATNASVPTSSFRVISGNEMISEYQSSPGSFRAFCSRCGSPVYGRSDAFPQIRRIRLGVLDHDPGCHAIAHIWLESKAPWFEVTDSLERFDHEAPVSFFLPG